MRLNSRAFDSLRDVSFTTGVNPHAEGSCLVKFGLTEVLCTASVQEKIPQWLKGKGHGWVTAEYGMLPRATADRKDREATRGKIEGRTAEIQRLIGRSLRTAIDLKPLDGLTIWLDCDVLVADGGTRTASITGAYVALAIALKHLKNTGKIKENPLKNQVAAISCGISEKGAVLDMDYVEDSTTLADGNFVMNSAGAWVELQISAEKRAMGPEELLELQRLAEKGIREIFDLQRQAIDLANVS